MLGDKVMSTRPTPSQPAVSKAILLCILMILSSLANYELKKNDGNQNLPEDYSKNNVVEFNSTFTEVKLIQQNVTAFATGEYQLCVVVDYYELKCTGRDIPSGQSNAESYDTFSSVGLYPVFNSPTKIIDIDLGRLHGCLLLANKSMYCFGHNGNSQVSPMISSKYVNKISYIDFGNNNVTKMAVDGGESCAAVESPTNSSTDIFCWGKGHSSSGSTMLNGKAAKRATVNNLSKLYVN